MKTVGIFPFGGPGNPYTEMLSQGLSDAGYLPKRLQDTKYFPLRRAVHSGVDALHLLWPGNLYHSSTVFGTWLKQLMFKDGLRCLAQMPASYSADNLFPHDAADVAHEIRMVQRIVNSVRAVTVASVAAESLFRRTYSVPTHVRIFQVPHRHYIGKYPDTVTKLEARERLGLPASAPVALSLGRITPYKGLPALVDAFLNADVSGSLLLIAGSEKVPGTVASIRQRARQANYSISVRIDARFIPDEEIQLYLRAADVMALSYDDVPMNPGSVLLAMSFGLPVMCVSEGSVPEILGGTLYGYDRGDSAGQAAALRTALLDKDGARDRGCTVRRLAEMAHSPERVAAALGECFQHVFR